ncbi:hypothetical protein SAMN05216474_2792 [Lishizhenia tianjinensis]|uniref:Uncharacterized protein n=1 Tax=Lishizhenia tianjinensis TaxID=477690 RepID=A0A1I7BFQ3_9FLAO|nr:hypothetical protein [Lishizhenia tianjinensis]SFT86010.1 hypothetical protein SAMN05216474_2792 [Lishizhenia tianjinensis]
MKTLKSLITLALILIATVVIAEEKRTLSKEAIETVYKHASKLKAQGVTLQQIQAKYQTSSSDDCLDKAWEFGSQFEDEFLQWVATDAYMSIHCLGEAGLDTDGEEDC